MKLFLIFTVSLWFLSASAAEVKTELKNLDPAPMFQAKTHEGKSFDLKTQKGKWTVLYFFPKAGTPGCTEQACAFRDSLDKIHEQGAEVFGISTDTVEKQAQFHKDQKLNFTLLADPDGKITDLYGSKMPLLNVSKRWTFIIDPNLKIRDIEKEVNTAEDAHRVANKISDLKSSEAKKTSKK